MIKAGIFDVGGVLQVNNNSYIYEDIAKTLKISDDLLQDGLSHELGPFIRGKIGEQEFWKKFIVRTKATGKLPKESLYGREYNKRFSKNYDVLDLVKKIKKAGYPLAILSDSIFPHTNFNIKKGVYEGFDTVVLSDTVGLNKPDPKIFIYTLDKLNVKAEEAFFIDDLQINVDAARKLGINGIKFENKDQLERELKKLGVRF